MLDVVIRQGNKEDHPFIYKSWLMSFQQSAFCYFLSDFLSQGTYFKNQTRIIQNILDSLNTRILVATAKDMPELIYGFLVYKSSSKILHYIYVKKAFTRFGIATLLLKNLPFQLNENVYASHLTYQGEKILLKYKLTYNPYLMVENERNN